MAPISQVGATVTSRLRRSVLLLAAVVVVAGLSFRLLASTPPPTPSQRIAQIESQVKCPSCDGVSALDSNTAGAFAVRSFVKQSVSAGRTNADIFASLEASYGPNIMMSPPSANGGTIIKILPFGFVVIVVLLVGFFGFRRRRRFDASADGSAPSDATNNSVIALAAELPNDDFVAPVVIESNSAPELPQAQEDLSSVRRLNSRRRITSFRESWLLYLGVVFLIGGIGVAIFVTRVQNSARNQSVAAFVQGRNEAQIIVQARALANQGQDVQALKVLSSVLVSDPNQPVALAYQGWLLRQAGEKDKSAPLVNQGQLLLEKAVKLDPAYPDARVFLGLILYQDRHDVSGAVVQFKAFLADKPSASFINATKSVMIAAFEADHQPVPSVLKG